MTHREPGLTITERVRSYHTLGDALLAAPSDATFVTFWSNADDGDPVEQRATFGELLARARRYAAWYARHGVARRDTVVLILSPSIDLMAAFAGALLAGIVPTVLASPTFKTDGEKYRSGLAGVMANLRARLVVIDAGVPDSLAPYLTGLATARFVESEAGGAWPSFSPSAEPDDVAFIQHSSGTTGLQKGVALSHRAVLNQLASLAAALDLRATDRVATWLPLYHDMGLIATFLLPLVAHLPVVMQSPTDWVLWPGSFLQLVTTHRCTLAWQPNFAFQFLARRVGQDERDAYDLSCLRALVSCSEPVRAESVDEFVAAYERHGLAPHSVQASYAMAEAVFAVTHGPPTTVIVDGDALRDDGVAVPVAADHRRARRLLSSGRCLEGQRLRVVDEDDVPRPQGAVGELAVAGTSLFSGYYGRDDLTARVLRDGWYHTGDTGFVIDGEVFVLGRRDDVIIVGGKNLHPEDMEAIATAHPDVHDGRAVAFGLYNADLGTDDIVVIAETVLEVSRARARAIEAEIRHRVSSEIGVAPRVVVLVEPRWIVKSTAGKPARSATRAKLLRERPELQKGRP
jgi:acyl-CoA synthetase (AMP-forming)/AMP-acid ligase II